MILSEEQRKAELEKASELLAEYDRKIEAAKESDPFWFYEPSDGSIADSGLSLMREFLKPDDIPQGKLECQLDIHKSTAEVILDAGGNQGG